MVLSDQERNSELFKKLIAHFDELLKQAQIANEKTLDVVPTAMLRGRMKLLRQLKLLAAPATPKN